MGVWNVLSEREDDHLFLLSSEFKHLDIGIAALRFGDRIVERSWQVVTPTIGLVTDGHHAQRVAAAVSNKLTPMIIKGTPVK